jgi:hypothetical protein
MLGVENENVSKMNRLYEIICNSDSFKIFPSSWKFQKLKPLLFESLTNSRILADFIYSVIF